MTSLKERTRGGILLTTALLLNLFITEARAQYLPGCFGGGYNSMPGFNPWMPSWLPGYNPWWAGPGFSMYSNFGFPGAWQMQSGFMNGDFYPPGHNIGMGKPNLYVHGKPGTEVQIKVQLAPKSNWLVAVPAHGTQGWKAKLMENGKLLVGEKAVYDFFFYDFRSDDSSFQSEAGFCSGREEVVSRISIVLKTEGFTENEIQDFKAYWNIKLPPSEGFCVFPQRNRELDQVARLEVMPKPKKILRMSFIIVPDEAMLNASVQHRFHKRPKKAWPAAPRTATATAAAADLELHEWGVGFIMK